MRIGKIAYGALFAVVLPLALWLWAQRLNTLLRLPIIGNREFGVILASVGVALMVAAITALRIDGGGWPMSPYPPCRRVRTGPYAIMDDPIYVAAVLIAAGVAIAVRNAAGIWIVTPVLACTCAAFVIGYERDATDRLFGAKSDRPILRLPKASNAAPEFGDRVSIYVLVFLPWLIAYQAVNALGAPADVRFGWSRWDAAIPIWPWTELIYFAAYPMVLAVPLVARSKNVLRDFALQGWLATALITTFYLVFPIAVPPRAVPTDALFGWLMHWERAFDAPLTALPAFHVVWVMIAAAAFRRSWLWIAAVVMSLACLTTGMHAMFDVAAGFAAGAIIINSDRIWRALRRITERVANSWREWDLGFVRMMSHGLYAAAGAFVGIIIVGMLAGNEQLPAIIFIALAAIVGAALWAQFVEGSPALLRPFGYYGGILGGCSAVALSPILGGERWLLLAAIVGAALWAQFVEGSPALLRPFGYYGGILGGCSAVALSPIFGGDRWLLLAAYCVAAPVVQAFGRIRCLVQGCCHGRPASVGIGIRYRHPRSRVTRLSDLHEVPLHPTQLYSILWNLFAFAVLMRLWIAGAPLALVCGAYFILNGLGRFVEEHYRGEPQTEIIAGLRVYQWLAIASVVAGGLLTVGDSRPAGTVTIPSLPIFIAATIVGAITYCAYGVDFPRLNVRFARLV